MVSARLGTGRSVQSAWRPGSLARWLGGLALLGLLLGPQGPALAQAGKAISVAYMPIANCLQFFVALDKGFFTEQGVEAKRKVLAGGAVIAPALEAGDVQVGYSNSISVIVAHDRGFDFQIITPAPLHEAPKHVFNGLLAGANSSITTLKDLEGKRLALNTLGNINDLNMKVIAAKYGIDLAKVKLLEVDFPKMEPALRNNQIDAAIVTEPFYTVVAKNKVGRPVLADTFSAIAPRFLVAVWFAKKAWMDANPELAEKFSKAMNRATDYINGHMGEMPELVSRYTKLTAALAKEIGWAGFSTSIKKSDLQVLIDSSQKYGFIKKTFNAGDVVSKFVPITD